MQRNLIKYPRPEMHDVLIDDIHRELTPSGKKYIDMMAKILPYPELVDFYHMIDPLAQEYLKKKL